jgi:hypothetical protein
MLFKPLAQFVADSENRLDSTLRGGCVHIVKYGDITTGEKTAKEIAALQQQRVTSLPGRSDCGGESGRSSTHYDNIGAVNDGDFAGGLLHKAFSLQTSLGRDSLSVQLRSESAASGNSCRRQRGGFQEMSSVHLIKKLLMLKYTKKTVPSRPCFQVGCEYFTIFINNFYDIHKIGIIFVFRVRKQRKIKI